MKLVIQREKWGAGRLLRSDGRMCCLGHLAVACGAKKADIKNKILLERSLTRFAYGHFKRDYIGGDIQSIATDINDDIRMSIKEKEERLKILFKAHDIKLSFKGKVTNEQFKLTKLTNNW